MLNNCCVNVYYKKDYIFESAMNILEIQTVCYVSIIV